MEDYKYTKNGQLVARKYADILEKSRPRTEQSLRRHPRMPLQNRAKIFAPFAALRGYEDGLDEMQREKLANDLDPGQTLEDWLAPEEPIESEPLV